MNTILNKAKKVGNSALGYATRNMLRRFNRSNGVGKVSGGSKVVQAINNATGSTRIVRNMMPRTKGFTKKVELPLYMFLNSSGELKLFKSINRTGPINLPCSGLEFTESKEYTELTCEVDTLRLISLGSSVNFVNEDFANPVTPVNILEKWMYGQDPERNNAKYDSTWQPLEYEKKGAQYYKTLLPNDTQGYKTYYSPVAFTDTLRNVRYDLILELPDTPDIWVFIGTMTLAMWVECKRKNVISVNSVLQTQIVDLKSDIEKKDDEIKTLKQKVNLLIGNQ